LHVGIGRPVALYVLYPWNGGTVLCRGAVLPYHEFVSQTRLTDGEWRALLDSDKRPTAPEWLGFIRSHTGETKPVSGDGETPEEGE